MTNYKDIWDSLNKESALPKAAHIIFRKIRSEGKSVFLASDAEKGLRFLFVEVGQDEIIEPAEFPGFRGLSIDIIVVDIGAVKNGRFVKLSQVMLNSSEIFEYMIADVCDKVSRVGNGQMLAGVLKQVLDEWRTFFEKKMERLLSAAQQKGLFGELSFFKDYLLKKYHPGEAVPCWTGADRTNHDFQLRSVAVEVKATSGKQHKKFGVSSENQLDTNGLSHLYLVLYLLSVHSNHSNTLPALIGQIESILNHDVASLYCFQIQLIKYGYQKKHADRYRAGFVISNINIYEIIPGFPRITAENLPVGTGDIRYSVSVAGCQKFQVNEDLINLI